MSRESNKKYPDEYKLTNSFERIFGILLMIMVLVLVLWSVADQQDSLLFTCIFCIFVILFILFFVRNLEYVILNHNGVLIVHEDRWRKKKEEYYVEWKQVESIDWEVSYSLHADCRIIIRTYDDRRSYKESTGLFIGKFVSLAKYYSGRDDIVRRVKFFKKKRKPFEKDW